MVMYKSRNYEGKRKLTQQLCWRDRARYFPMCHLLKGTGITRLPWIGKWDSSHCQVQANSLLSQMHIEKLVCVCVSYSVVSDSATTGLKLFCPCNSPGKSTGVDCHSPLQGIFPNQGSNPGLPHCRQILYHVSQQGGPKNCEWWQQGEKGIPKGTDQSD